MWPPPVYQEWPPSKFEHQAIGWSSSTPSLPSCSLVGRLVERGQDVDVVARAVVPPLRPRRQPAACSCTTRRCGSSGSERAPWRDAWRPRHRWPRSACRADVRRSRRPPGRRTSPSRTPCRRRRGCRRSRCPPGCSSRRRSAALRSARRPWWTARRPRRTGRGSRRVNAVESSVASTAKPLAAPICWIAAMPAGIESCRKPAVSENTSTLSSGAADATPADIKQARSTPTDTNTAIRRDMCGSQRNRDDRGQALRAGGWSSAGIRLAHRSDARRADQKREGGAGEHDHGDDPKRSVVVAAGFAQCGDEQRTEDAS